LHERRRFAHVLPNSITLFVVTLLSSCNKERLPLGRHFKMYVGGKKILIDACGSSSYAAYFEKDTAMSIDISCGTGAGFYLKGKIIGGTYALNDTNFAFYGPLNGAG